VKRERGGTGGRKKKSPVSLKKDGRGGGKKRVLNNQFHVRLGPRLYTTPKVKKKKKYREKKKGEPSFRDRQKGGAKTRRGNFKGITFSSG